MTEQKLWILLISIFVISTSCSDNKEPYDPTKDLVEIDYISDLGYFRDLTLMDGEVYALAYDQTYDSYGQFLKKVSEDGTISIVLDLNDGNYTGNNWRITNLQNKLYWTADMGWSRDKILSFSDDFSTVETIHTVKGSDAPFTPRPSITSIVAFAENSLVFFDASYRQLKRYYPQLGVDVVIAGSEKQEITDGTGLEASFYYVNKMTTFGDDIYLVDNQKNIRKIEPQGDGFPKVTTILADCSETINDIAVAANGDIYAGTSNGIFILEKGATALKLIANKYNIEALTKNKVLVNMHLGGVSHLYIDHNDMYIIRPHASLTKISNFKATFQEFADKDLLIDKN